MCDAGYAGVSCNMAVEPTGEQIQPFEEAIAARPCPIVDVEMKVRLSAFLVYTSSRVVLGKHVTTAELLTVFRARGKALESEGALWVCVDESRTAAGSTPCGSSAACTAAVISFDVPSSSNDSCTARVPSAASSASARA